MSMHPSLAMSGKDEKQRSILKRTERIRQMMEKGDWKEGDKVYGLPKLKTVRIKIKKEKVEKAAETATTAGTAAAAPKEQAAGAKAAPKT
ncbi:MAG: small basic protein [Candidatus Omnitrophica bacterium CG08_land_8_20_14_0_20_41_16]|uniref:Small basic protein n=1 Tax=Candidatus Sherwoodlollariibacterium unditelluris TaxID=1974757 RepID=A0A2G9YL12_9BACT|nr:MAG: small basic protein [Candidatus Omnitrophica bacterium CG23_combo_of_CG06-09_8_20_14_all_41_10]PIS33612.1 MAG: small basic protein [Candidatus Omnitrophica bacterium CG08_land_8_20_14_0_20_41_16]